MGSPGLASQARKLGYRTFYLLPGAVRRRLVRLVLARYMVGAVALVRDSEAPAPGRLLLLRQPPGLGWNLPAGLLKRHERPIDGCARELEEESGIALTPDDEGLDFRRQLRVPRQGRNRCDGADGHGGGPPWRRSCHEIRLRHGIVYRASNYTGIHGKSAPFALERVDWVPI